MQQSYSHARVPVAWIMDPRIERDELAVVTVLLGFTDGRSGLVKIRQGRVGELLEKSRAWVNAVIKRLAKHDFIEIVASPHGRAQTYRVLLPTSNCQQEDSSRSSQNSDTGCQPADTVLPDSASKDTLSKFAWDVFSDDWVPSDEALAQARRLYPKTDLKRHLKHFISKILSRGYRYYDLDDAWLQWLTTDAKSFPITTSSDQSPCKESDRHAKPKRSGTTKTSVFDQILGDIGSRAAGSERNDYPAEDRRPTGNAGPLLAVLAQLSG